MLARDPQTLGPLPPLLGLESFQVAASVVDTDWHTMMVLSLRRADGSLRYIEMPPGLQERESRHAVLAALAPSSSWILERWEQTECGGNPCFIAYYQERATR